jgi:DNA-binding winged helix-turn-helix (wHTH) protein/tetratricopeptide (TPR) repeat protein
MSTNGDRRDFAARVLKCASKQALWWVVGPMAAGADPKTKQLYKFGPFRVDPDKELLLRNRETVPLAPKAFQILLVLIRHSKEVVTKDDLMKNIWPDTFVEEANLSRNIFLLRRALGETPQDHQYILTVPGRGYRFADEVQLVPEQELSIVAASHAEVQVQITETSKWRWVAIAAALVVVVAATLLRFVPRRTTLLTEKDTVVLADFANSTGDPVFDGTLRQGLSVQLSQSPFLGLISDERIQQTLRFMGKTPTEHLTANIAREICERTGSTAVLDGSIAPLGNQYVLGLNAVNCHSGEVLDQEQIQAARKEDVLNALSQIASSFRKKIGESLATIKQHNTPLQQATTSSLEALKECSLGWDVHHSQGPAAAIPFFKRAIEIDPDFATAHAMLALLYSHTGESGLATQTIRRAHELRDHASDEERFFIDAYYDGRATGNQERAQQTCEEWERTYPREIRPHQFLAGFIYTGLARHDKAVEQAQEAIGLDPDESINYQLLGGDQLYLDDVDGAENTLRYAATRKLEIPDLLILRYDLAFVKNDEAEMGRLAAQARETSGAEDWVAQHQAFVLAYHGRMQDAMRMSRHATDLAQQTGHTERAALFAMPPALWRAFFGNKSEAKRDALAALGRSGTREVRYGAALALALSQDSSRAESLGNALEKELPEDTAVKFSYLPSVRALLALNKGEPSKAIEFLQIAAPYEFAAPRSTLQGFFGALYPAYIRGLAYLASHDGTQAVTEFQKILDHRGLVISDPVGALAHLQQGRAYAMVGDKNKAKSAYQDFLNLWKDADPEIPILNQARVEYATLQ